MSAIFLSRSSSYAIRAMAYLAAQPPERFCGAREIADHEEIPHPFLWKILQALRHRRLLRSIRGAGGGYALALHPSQIRLIDIVEALEDVSEMNSCVLGKGQCPAEHTCFLHERLRGVRESFLGVMESTTLVEILHNEPCTAELASMAAQQTA